MLVPVASTANHVCCPDAMVRCSVGMNLSAGASQTRTGMVGLSSAVPVALLTCTQYFASALSCGVMKVADSCPATGCASSPTSPAYHAYPLAPCDVAFSVADVPLFVHTS